MNDSRLVIKLTQDVVVSLSFACGIETVLRIHGKEERNYITANWPHYCSDTMSLSAMFNYVSRHAWFKLH